MQFYKLYIIDRTFVVVNNYFAHSCTASYLVTDLQQSLHSNAAEAMVLHQPLHTVVDIEKSAKELSLSLSFTEDILLIKHL